MIEKLTEIVCAKTGVKTKEKIKALEVLAKHLRPFDKQSLECPELPDPDVKAKVSLEAISKEESQAFAIANLLSPLERHRVRKALEKWMEAQEHSKPTEAAESALEEDGNGEDEQDDSDIIELMKDVLGEERIKRSVQVSVESLLSRRQLRTYRSARAGSYLRAINKRLVASLPKWSFRNWNFAKQS